MTDNVTAPYIKDLSLDNKTIGYHLRQRGYHTAYKGKWHLSEIEHTSHSQSDALEPYGFSEFNEVGDIHGEILDGYHHDKNISQDAAAWLHKRATSLNSNQPWFLAVNFVNPHDVMFFDTDGPDGDIQVSQHFEINAAPSDAIYQKNWKAELPKSFFQNDPRTKPSAHKMFKELNDFLYGSVPHERVDLWENRLNYYINCVRDVDRHIHSLMQALIATGEADRTIIIFTADHGEMAGAHGLRQKGPMAYDENLRVPLFLIHPDVKGGDEIKSISSSIDLLPTILSFAGLSEFDLKALHPEIAGYDISSSLQDPHSPSRREQRAGGVLFNYDSVSTLDPAFLDAISHVKSERSSGTRVNIEDFPKFDVSSRGLMRGTFDGRYKFARYFPVIDYNKPLSITELYERNDVELYDTHEDPQELHNLANNPERFHAIISEMNHKLNMLLDREIKQDRTNIPFNTFEDHT